MCLCPECGTQIEIKDTKERVIREKSYFNIITTIEDYQVVRMFLMMVEMRKGMKVKPAYLEIGQYFIDPNGNKTIVAIPRTLGCDVDTFAFSAPLEIRNDGDAYMYVSDQWVYPRIKVTDTIKRNGFKNSVHHICKDFWHCFWHRFGTKMIFAEIPPKTFFPPQGLRFLSDHTEFSTRR